MRFLAPIASIFGIELDAVMNGVKRQVALATILACLGVIAAIFLLVAGFLALSNVLGGVIAALTLAGGALVLALLVYLGSQIGRSDRKRLELERRRKAEANTIMTTAAVTAVPAMLRSGLGKAVGLPLVALAAFLVLRGRGGADD